MATEAQLLQGLQAADAAGNTADAQHFADQIKAMRSAAVAPTSAPAAAPRWDVLGDIGRAASSSANALSQDLSTAFPGPKAAENGPLGTIKRMGSALKAPLDAAGVLLSPVTGALHGIGGSALSYALPTIPGEDTKQAADSILDKAMLGLAPDDPAAMAAGAGTRAAASQARTDALLKNRAIQKVADRARADNLTPQQVIDAQAAANANGDKLSLMDLGDKNVRGLAGAVYRAPGPAGKNIGDFLDTRNADASGALTSDIQTNVAKGSTYSAVQDLLNARSAAAQPAFKEAMTADSTAPFESQYRDAVMKATGVKGQIARQMAEIEQNNPGALAARGAAGADVRAKYMDLHEQLQQSEADRQAALTVFKKAQEDGTANAPGATWSPRLQQFLNHPAVKSGLQEGLMQEMQDAIAQNRPFKPSDYSIVGTDEQGKPIVGAVPTMKSLAVAKEGLDGIVAGMRDQVTGRPTKAGLSLGKFRDAFRNELDNINPRYKTAREAWSGPTQSMEAVIDGRQHFSRSESNDQLKAEFDALPQGDKDFYRMGAAEAKVDQLERAPDASDKSKRVVNSERDRKRFRMLFDSDAQAQQFLDAVARKRTAFDTAQAIKGNSATVGRLAEDDALGNAPLALEGARTLAHASGGNVLGAAAGVLRMKRELGLRNNPPLNLEISRLLTNPDFASGRGNNFLTPLPVLPRNNTVRKLLGSELLAAQNGARPQNK